VFLLSCRLRTPKNNLKKQNSHFFFSLSLFPLFLVRDDDCEREKTKNEWVLSCCNIQTNLEKKNETASLTRGEEKNERVTMVAKNKNKISKR
jgi:hypothetical protein